MPGVFLYCPPNYFLGQYSLNLELDISAGGIGQQTSEDPSLGFQVLYANLRLNFYVGSRDLNSGTCACAASSLHTEASLQYKVV